jgi:hypothetical protein
MQGLLKFLLAHDWAELDGIAVDNENSFYATHFLIKKTLADQRGEYRKEFRKITIDRNDIIMGLADLAQNPLADARARVAAWAKLADIFCLVPKSLKDAKDFYGWTEEELEEYRRSNGEFVPDG